MPQRIADPRRAGAAVVCAPCEDDRDEPDGPVVERGSGRTERVRRRRQSIGRRGDCERHDARCCALMAAVHQSSPSFLRNVSTPATPGAVDERLRRVSQRSRADERR
jgi:hypothetical protein